MVPRVRLTSALSCRHGAHLACMERPGRGLHADWKTQRCHGPAAVQFKDPLERLLEPAASEDPFAARHVGDLNGFALLSSFAVHCLHQKGSRLLKRHTQRFVMAMPFACAAQVAGV